MTQISPSEDIRSVTDLKRNTRDILDHLHATGRPVILTVMAKPIPCCWTCVSTKNICRREILQSFSPRLNGMWKAAATVLHVTF